MQKISLFSQRTLNFSKTVEYRFSIGLKEHQLVVFESSSIGIEYWLDGEVVSESDEVSSGIKVSEVLSSFEN
jgi:hypothetical protein